MEQHDVIIVGLGCVGTSTLYYASKHGLKVLGIEMFSAPGSFGTSSFGETRLWRVTHGKAYKNQMMRDAVKLWRELEEESGEELLVQFPVLTMGSLKAVDYQDVAEQFPDHPKLTPEEISEKFPALQNIPDDYEGILHDECGIVRAKKALTAAVDLAVTKYGAEVKFDSKVAKISTNSCTLENGETYTAKNIVVCAGPYSKSFDPEKVSHKREIEYLVFDDIKGLPQGIIEFDEHGNEFYGMVDGPKLDRYKMGEFATRSIDSMLKYFQNRLPGKLNLSYIHPCYITMIDTGEFQYKTDEEGIHYAYGFSGTGFKFMPLHGKIVVEGLIKKKDQTHIPEKFRAKI